MRNLIFVLTLHFFISVNAYGQDNQSVFDVSFKTDKLGSLALKDFQGKMPVYIKFWASWCQPCMKEMPHFQSVQARLGKKIQVIGINLGINDTPEDVARVIRQFGLSMATAIDHDGSLAQAFKFIGTPYHLIFDKNLNLVHRGHKADEALDNKLALLSTDKTIDELSNEIFAKEEKELVIEGISAEKTVLFFTATWCDWYLKETRPSVAKNCAEAQQSVKQLTTEFSSVNWVVIVSSLWTGQQDLNQYVKKYDLTMSSMIDHSNKSFIRFKVKDFPTLIVLQEGKEVYRATGLFEPSLVKRFLVGL